MVTCIAIVKMLTKHSHLSFRCSKLTINTIEPGSKLAIKAENTVWLCCSVVFIFKFQSETSFSSCSIFFIADFEYVNTE